MVLMTVEDLTKKINDKVLFENASFSIEEGEKIGLIGTNGSGKSTLLKVIADKEPYTAGTIIKKNGLKIAYLSQNPLFTEHTIWDEMKKDTDKIPEYKIKSILTKLGFNDFSLSIDTLSGGQKKRLALAKTLLYPCDLLILDEPTNHLDDDMIEWLENYLNHLKTALFMITHDRYFLDRICKKIIEIDRGRIYIHTGNYASYVEAKAKRDELDAKRIQKYKNLYRKELAWVQAGVQARSTKQKSRLDRFEKLRNMRFKEHEKNLELNDVSKRLGKKTIICKNLGFGYEKPLFHHLSYTLQRQDRLGIIGPNGCGKTTLLNVIAGDIQPTQGSIEYGTTVSIGYFRQGDQKVDTSMRAIDYITEVADVIHYGKETITAGQMMERFLFPKGMHYTTLDHLSGGERRRLYLCRILMQAPNILLLDEPTNDLDILTLEVLEDYLDQFQGAIITVSHDRYFLDRVVDHVFVYQNDATLKEYNGGYSNYLEQKGMVKKEHVKKIRVKKRSLLSYQEKKELEKLPEKMNLLEKEIQDYDDQMNKNQEDFKKVASLSEKRKQANDALEVMTMRWMELEEKNEE